jgi:hypothetical protein
MSNKQIIFCTRIRVLLLLALAEATRLMSFFFQIHVIYFSFIHYNRNQIMCYYNRLIPLPALVLRVPSNNITIAAHHRHTTGKATHACAQRIPALSVR